MLVVDGLEQIQINHRNAGINWLTHRASLFIGQQLKRPAPVGQAGELIAPGQPLVFGKGFFQFTALRFQLATNGADASRQLGHTGQNDHREHEGDQLRAQLEITRPPNHRDNDRDSQPCQ